MTPMHIAIPSIVTACIVGILYWLYRKWRVKKPPAKDPKA